MEKKKEIIKEESALKDEQAKSSKNIIIIGVIIIALILCGWYAYKWYKVKQDEKLMNSYLLSSGTVTLEIKNLDEVSYYKTEAPSTHFVLISYTGSKDTYDLEYGLKSIIDKYKLNDEFYYLSVDSIKDEDNYITRLNTAFNTDKISTVPVILYYKDNEIIDVVKRLDENVIKAADFQKLLDINDF